MKIESRDYWLAKITHDIPENELCYLIKEIADFRRIGILSDNTSKFKEFCRKASEICNTSYGEMMRTTEDIIIFEAARRYYNQFN